MATITQSFPTTAKTPGGFSAGQLAYGSLTPGTPGFLNSLSASTSFKSGQLVKVIKSPNGVAYPTVDTVLAADVTTEQLYYIIAFDQKLSVFDPKFPPHGNVGLFELGLSLSIYMLASVAIDAGKLVYWSTATNSVTSTSASGVTTPSIGIAESSISAGGLVQVRTHRATI